jgi:hypothetical protein
MLTKLINNVMQVSINNISRKSKAIPLQTRTGPEGSRRVRHPDFKTIGI